MRGYVLYVEDDDFSRRTYADALRKAGLIVQEERSTSHALDVLSGGLPAVILLNLEMPASRISGIEMLVRLRNVPEWALIPVVVLSGLGDVVNPDIMARLNVSTVLSKTLRGDEVARLIGNLLQRQDGETRKTV
jgi:CheY-like chemotaxis protein